MNRAERRKAGITAKPRTYVLTDVELEKIKQEIKRNAVDEAFVMLLGIPLLVMRDHHGFGKMRITRFMEAMLGWYEGICDGTASIKDVLDVLKSEADIDVTVDAKRIMVETRAQKKDEKRAGA